LLTLSQLYLINGFQNKDFIKETGFSKIFFTSRTIKINKIVTTARQSLEVVIQFAEIERRRAQCDQATQCSSQRGQRRGQTQSKPKRQMRNQIKQSAQTLIRQPRQIEDLTGSRGLQLQPHSNPSAVGKVAGRRKVRTMGAERKGGVARGAGGGATTATDKGKVARRTGSLGCQL